MNTVRQLIREIDRQVKNEGHLYGSVWKTMREKYLEKPPVRIPAKREKPRVKRDLAPRTDKNEALTIYPDGREVCNDTAEGLELYARRRIDMARRQGWKCAISGQMMCVDQGYWNSVSFDHQNGRGGGKRDDRIWDKNGNPMNAAVCYGSNIVKGSKRTPYQFQTKITKAEWEAKEKL